MSLKSEDDEILAEELEERVDEALDEDIASADEVASAFQSD
jgi:hypothetical protein